MERFSACASAGHLDQLRRAGSPHQQRLGLEGLHGPGHRILKERGRIAPEIPRLKGAVAHGSARRSIMVKSRSAWYHPERVGT